MLTTNLFSTMNAHLNWPVVKPVRWTLKWDQKKCIFLLLLLLFPINICHVTQVGTVFAQKKVKVAQCIETHRICNSSVALQALTRSCADSGCNNCEFFFSSIFFCTLFFPSSFSIFHLQRTSLLCTFHHFFCNWHLLDTTSPKQQLHLFCAFALLLTFLCCFCFVADNFSVLPLNICIGITKADLTILPGSKPASSFV